MCRYLKLAVFSVLLALPLGCQESQDHFIPLHNLDKTESALDLAPVDLQVFRVSGPERLSQGDSWELRAEAQDPEGGQVSFQWKATSGTLSRDQGEFTFFTASESVGRAEIEILALDPEGNQLSGTFAVRVLDDNARGPVMDVRDYVGDYCSLAIDSGDHPHIAFHNYTHPTLLHAFHDGSAWQIETIEGYGLDVGGAAGEHASLALDGSGVPHIAYLVEYAEEPYLSLNYATKSSGSWQLVTVDYSSNRGIFNVVLKINPVTQKPEILYNASDRNVVKYAICSGNCTQGASWSTSTVYTETRCYYANNCNYAFAGGLAIENDGTRHATISGRYYDSNYDDWAEVIHAVASFSSWDTTERIIDLRENYYIDEDDDASRLVLDRNNQLMMLHRDGVYHRTGAFAWNLSKVEKNDIDDTNSDYGRFDIHCDRQHTPPASGVTWIASPHGGSLELVKTNPRSYFEYTYIGSISSTSRARASVAVDGAGVGHLCWVDNGVLMYE